VLRRLAREGPPPVPDATADPLGWLTTAGSLPEWIARRWLSRLGPDGALARARQALDEPPCVLRLNPRVPDALEQLRQAGYHPTPLTLPGAFLVRGGRPADLHAAGVVYIQDEAAQAIGQLAAGPGLTLDACAAPGGKALLIADQVASRGHVIAAEASLRRLRTLSRLAGAWRASNLSLVGADALQPPFEPARFEQLLLDAPCSGLGTLAQNPDLRWRVTLRDLDRHAQRQRRLLAAAAELVRPGGRLIYATCSTESEENEAVVSDFLVSRPHQFAAENLPRWAARLATGSSGYFAAVLRRA
jgi:16S rRNA (cytosine967-C5)-methyltransferase